MKSKGKSLLRAMRVISGFALIGTVTAGTFFAWAPAVGVLSVHEIGALVGGLAGVVANSKHYV